MIMSPQQYLEGQCLIMVDEILKFLSISPLIIRCHVRHPDEIAGTRWRVTFNATGIPFFRIYVQDIENPDLLYIKRELTHGILRTSHPAAPYLIEAKSMWEKDQGEQGLFTALLKEAFQTELDNHFRLGNPPDVLALISYLSPELREAAKAVIDIHEKELEEHERNNHE